MSGANRKQRFLERKKLGSVKLHNANALYPSGLKLRVDSGRVYVDVDTLEETPNYLGGDYLHLGVSGDVKVEEMASKRVKGHLDIYIPISQLEPLIDMLIKEQVRR